MGLGTSWLQIAVFLVLLFSVSSTAQEKDGSSSSEETDQDIVSTPVKRPQTVITIPDFIGLLMRRYGPRRVKSAFASLDELPIGQVLRILIVKVDPLLEQDIQAMQAYAQRRYKSAKDKKENEDVIQVIARIVAGDKTVAKDVIRLDHKLVRHDWWRRIRARMLVNLDRYVSNHGKN